MRADGDAATVRSTRMRGGVRRHRGVGRGPRRARAYPYPGSGFEMFDDLTLCSQAGYCGDRFTTVWAMLGDSDDDAIRARIRRMVMLCPSGRPSSSLTERPSPTNSTIHRPSRRSATGRSGSGAACRWWATTASPTRSVTASRSAGGRIAEQAVLRRHASGDRVPRRIRSRMKAAVHTRYGPPEVVRIAEVDKPTVGDHEVLVKVRVTTVNRTDCGFRAGKPFFVRLFTGLRQAEADGPWDRVRRSRRGGRRRRHVLRGRRQRVRLQRGRVRCARRVPDDARGRCARDDAGELDLRAGRCQHRGFALRARR